MTDVSPGNDGPGNAPAPQEPTGPRRSTFTPPAQDVEPPAFDDDALAEAMAAEVAAYTSPISVVPSVVPPVAPSPVPSAEPADVPVGWGPAAPTDEPPVEAIVPAPGPEPSFVDSEQAPADHESSTSSTLAAIQRLEEELQRRAGAASAPVDVPPVDVPPVDFAPVDFAPVDFAPVDLPIAEGAVPADRPFPESRLFPAPPTFIHAAPPVEPPVSFEPALLPEPVHPVEPEAVQPVEPPLWDPPPAPNFPPPDVTAPPAVAPSFPPPSFEPPASDPPTFEPPNLDRVDLDSVGPATQPPPLIEPPRLVDPPVPSTGTVPVLAPPPTTAAIDLPPPGAAGAADRAQLAHLPPPVGIEPAEVSAPTDFDALLGAAPVAHPDDLGVTHPGATHPGATHPGATQPEAGPFPLSEPVYVTPAIDRASDTDDDAVDDVDRAFSTGAMVVDSTGAVSVVASPAVDPPSAPIPTVRLADDKAALVDDQLESHPALVVESAGIEPTALDLRAGRAARLFWLWFAANSSVISLSLGAVIFGLGMSLRQALIAIVVGVALSFLPLGRVTLAGKWSGQSTMIVSRATFGLVGNALPALLAVVSRVFWGGALLWLLATGVAQVLVDSGLDAGLGQGVWTLVGLGAGFLLTFVIAIFGYGLIARVQLVLSILTALLVVGVIAVTYPRLDLAAAQLADDGPWILVVTGVVLVFSFVGLAWVHSSADVARYQRTSSDGGSSMLWATFGATLPAFALIAWGALLAASDPLIAEGLATNPLRTIAALLPIWYPAPLIGAVALGLLSGVVLTMYSGGFALQSLGIRTRRSVTTAIAGILVLAVTGALLFLAVDARGLIIDVATTIAVPVAAWAGIFAAEMIIRSRFSSAFDSHALLTPGGVYPAVRWVNLVGLVVISAVGFGLTSAVLPGLGWQGYLFPLLGLESGDPLLTSDVGVLLALALGILLPLITAVPTIRRQDRALVD